MKLQQAERKEIGRGKFQIERSVGEEGSRGGIYRAELQRRHNVVAIGSHCRLNCHIQRRHIVAIGWVGLSINSNCHGWAGNYFTRRKQYILPLYRRQMSSLQARRFTEICVLVEREITREQRTLQRRLCRRYWGTVTRFIDSLNTDVSVRIFEPYSDDTVVAIAVSNQPIKAALFS